MAQIWHMERSILPVNLTLVSVCCDYDVQSPQVSGFPGLLPDAFPGSEVAAGL